MDFKQIDAEHSRAKVPGGWLVKAYTDVLVKLHPDQAPVAGYEWRASICFVPDANHEWHLALAVDMED